MNIKIKPENLCKIKKLDNFSEFENESKIFKEIRENRDIVNGKIIELLVSTKREGISKLLEFLDRKDFFISPASSKFHGNYPGGLADHSLNVYQKFKGYCQLFGINLSEDSIIISSLLHDLCKAKLYKNVDGKWVYNIFVGNMGHAKFSIERIKRFIELKEIEEQIIKYHMGFYYATEITKKGEYSLQELKKSFNNNIVKLFYFCDDMVSMYEDKKV